MQRTNLSMQALLITWITITCVACGDSTPPPNSPPAQPAPVFELGAGTDEEQTGIPFAWPEGSTAIVTELATKQGNRTTTSYRIKIGAKDTAGARKLQLSDFELIDMEGVKMDDPMLLSSLAPAIAMMQAIPDYGVGTKGEYLGPNSGDLKRMADRVAGMLGELDKGLTMSPDEFRASMATPAMEQVLRAMNSDPWNAWVGNWASIDLEAGRELIEEIGIPMGEAKVPAQIITQHLGNVEEHAGHVRLSISMSLVGSELGAPVAAFLESMAKRMEAPLDGLAEIPALEWTFTSTAGAVLDPELGRPATAYYEKRVHTVPGDSGIERARIERHEYSFQWQ
ncbi:MAG: hypothetical protein ACI835_003578 [Planctomycetota bacterium]|jgi:hypothetical protein